MEPTLPPPAGRADRRALRTLQLGLIGVTLAASTARPFELDRFFVPKELVLHLTAGLAVWWTLGRHEAAGTGGDPGDGPDVPADAPRAPARTSRLLDLAVAAWLALSTVSAVVAPNRWLAARALAVTASGLGVFWAARALARRGLGRPLLATAAAATVLAAGSALLQAYGVQSDLFSINRAPGGTFGNRNFVAHLAAIGLPLLAGIALRARRGPAVALAVVGGTASTAMLVLSRTRAAWLAALVCLVPLAIGGWHATRAGAGGRVVRRVALLALACAAVAGAAVALPNTLEWRSDSPYADSMRGMVDYQRGSGGGRVKQWRNSARMLTTNPILGVGPGNWPVVYPRHAPPRDPSLTAGRMTSNPWPSSDWVAAGAERGVALGALVAAFALLAWTGHLAVWRTGSADAALAGGALGGLVGATAVAGAFDAVLLLAAPTLVFWTAAGVLVEDCRVTDAAETRLAVGGGWRRVAAGAFAGVLLVAAGRSAAQWMAMARFATGRPAAIAEAGRLDPGSYRIRLRQAELAARRGRCAEVRRHAGAAGALLPEAVAPKRLLARCR